MDGKSFALAFCFVAFCADASAQENAPAPAGDAEKGALGFSAYGCWACHGTTGAGGGWQGPKLAPDPIAYQAFMSKLRGPPQKMPRYSAIVLSDGEAGDLYAYLRSIPKGKPASEIEMLRRYGKSFL